MTPSDQMSLRPSTSLRRAHLLRRHVERRPDRHAGRRGGRRRRVRVGRDLRDAEVEHLEDALAGLLGQEQVRRLEIAVNDAGGVRLGDCDASLQDEVDGALDGKGAVDAQLGLEVAASQELHDHVRPAALVGVHVEHLHDVRTADARARASFALESLDRIGQGEDLLPQELDRDALAQAQVLGLEDEAHASLAERTKQSVLAADDVAGGRDPRRCPLHRRLSSYPSCGAVSRTFADTASRRARARMRCVGPASPAVRAELRRRPRPRMRPQTSPRQDGVAPRVPHGGAGCARQRRARHRARRARGRSTPCSPASPRLPPRAPSPMRWPRATPTRRAAAPRRCTGRPPRAWGCRRAPTDRTCRGPRSRSSRAARRARTTSRGRPRPRACRTRATSARPCGRRDRAPSPGRADRTRPGARTG